MYPLGQLHDLRVYEWACVLTHAFGTHVGTYVITMILAQWPTFWRGWWGMCPVLYGLHRHFMLPLVLHYLGTRGKQSFPGEDSRIGGNASS